MNHRKICCAVLLSLSLCTLLVGCGENSGFAIAEFKVVKNGAVLLEDKFNDTPAKLSDATPPKDASYQLMGRLAAPKNNRQILSYGHAIITPTNPNVMITSATLQTDTDPSNQSLGLKPGSTFEITGTFDMIVPDKAGQGFFIGLSDGQIGPNVIPKDAIALGYTLRRFGTNINLIFFRSIDYTSSAEGTVTNQTFAFVAPDGQQIKLRLRKTDAAVNRVTASYALVKQGVVGPYVELQQTIMGAGHMPIFRAHAYTRPMYGAFWPKEADLPEFSLAALRAMFAGKTKATPPPIHVIAPLSNTIPRAKEELIEIATRNRKAKVLLTYETGSKPSFVAVMIPGGDGSFHFESTPAGIAMLNQERLQNRLRPLLLQRGIASALLDAPDDNPEMRLSYRETPEHLADLKAALTEIGKRFPGVPLVVIGHSIGSWSATFLTAAAPEKIAATILIDPVLADSDVLNRYDWNKGIGDGLSRFDWDKLHRSILC